MQNTINISRTKRVGFQKISLSIIVALLLTALLLIPLSGCSALESSDVKEVKAQSFEVTFSGVVPSDSGTTFGAYVEKHCPNGTWESGTASGGVSIVNYNGGDSTDGKVNIQWSKGATGWSIWAIEVDGEPQSMLFTNTFFSKG